MTKEDCAEFAEILKRDNAILQERFIKRSRTLPIEILLIELSKTHGVKRQTIGNRQKQMRMFSVPVGREGKCREFQLESRKPKGIIREILNTIDQEYTPWGLASWSYGATGLSGNNSPVDCMDKMEAVVCTAKNTTEMPH